VEPSAEQVAAVESWLGRAFPDATVESRGFFDAEVQLFRARTPGGSAPAPELVVSYLAFEDYPDRIVSALERRKVAERLRVQPNKRLFLNRGLQLVAAPPGPLK